MAQPTETLLLALANFTCDDTALLKLVKDTLRALDKDLEEGDYESSKIAEKTFEELEDYMDDLNSYSNDEDEDDDDVDEEALRDVDDD